MSRHAWEDLRVVDFASHIHPSDPDNKDHEYIDEELGRPVYRDADEHRASYDDAGIEEAVLPQPIFMGHGDLGKTREANDALHDVLAARDSYYGLASIPTAAGVEEAASEFERCLDAGFNGGGLETMTPDGLAVHDDELAPILEITDRTGAPRLVHPKLHDSVNSAVLDDAWLLNAIMGREIALCASICKVVHTGVFDRYPNLNLVFHHTGGNIASVVGRLHSQLEKFPPEVWFDGDPPEPVKAYPEFKAQLEERVYIDTAGYYGYHDVVRSALSEFPTSQLLFGTDFPFETRTTEDFEAMLRAVAEETSRADAGRIFGRNALDLLVNVD